MSDTEQLGGTCGNSGDGCDQSAQSKSEVNKEPEGNKNKSDQNRHLKIFKNSCLYAMCVTAAMGYMVASRMDQNKIDNYKSAIDAKDREIASRKATLGSKDDEIRDLKSKPWIMENKQLAEERKNLEGQIDSLTRTVQAQEPDLNKRSGRIKLLEAQLAASESNCGIKEQLQQIKSDQQQINSKLSQIKNDPHGLHTVEIQTYQSEINRYQQQIFILEEKLQCVHR